MEAMKRNQGWRTFTGKIFDVRCRVPLLVLSMVGDETSRSLSAQGSRKSKSAQVLGASRAKQPHDGATDGLLSRKGGKHLAVNKAACQLQSPGPEAVGKGWL